MQVISNISPTMTTSQRFHASGLSAFRGNKDCSMVRCTSLVSICLIINKAYIQKSQTGTVTVHSQNACKHSAYNLKHDSTFTDVTDSAQRTE